MNIKQILNHPVGSDIVDKVLLQLNKPRWLVDNPLVRRLPLSIFKNFTGQGFIESLTHIIKNETDAPDTIPIKSAPAWWKEAVFYQIYPRSFAPGGLKALIEKLDELKDLGIDAIWLSPIYDSPNDDNGYDIRDYYTIGGEFGSMNDMDELIEALHSRDMKLVMDLVINHTSDEHPWFQAALKDENSPCRDYYFFKKSNNNTLPNNWTSFFGGSVWNAYPGQQLYAMHLFSKKQMDLNWENENLREELYTMVRWWLEKGVDGFRLDVINYISKPPDLPDGDPLIGKLMGYTGVEHYFYGSKLHTYLKELKEKAFKPYNAFSVGETPGIGIQAGRLLTDGYRNELDLIFSFDHLETPGHTRFDDYVYDPLYLMRFYRKHLNADLGHGWNTLFFNNHDNPRMVSKIDPSGKNTAAVAKMLAVLQMTLRGTPFLYQGDEIGAVNEHFTSIDQLQDVESHGLYHELIKTMEPEKALKKVCAGTRDHARAPLDWSAVSKQQNEPDSVWRFYKRLITLRKAESALVYGELQFLYPLFYTKLFTYMRTMGDRIFYIEVNLSSKKQPSHTAKTFLTSELLIGTRDSDDVMLHPYEARVYKIK